MVLKPQNNLSNLQENFKFHSVYPPQRNNLSGRIPASFQNWTNLQVLDLSENEFIGNVPSWIGESLLPLELCRLGYLQILDLADNNLSGTVPKCINNFSAMVTTDNFAFGAMMTTNNSVFGLFGHDVASIEEIFENTLLVMKGKPAEYSTILNLIRFIFLSINNISGEIPIEVTNLGALQSLNLSQNSFSGTIPESIGAMKSLEAIDVSANHLSGRIQQSFSNLTFLSYLNLSNNNLSGEFPLSTQLQSFHPSSFTGNELCGSSLEKCSLEVVPDYNYGKIEMSRKWIGHYT